jgi:uncharacterized membrane protein YbhN (UPF0104 family)
VRRVADWLESRPLLLPVLALAIATGALLAMAWDAGLAAVWRMLEQLDPTWLLLVLAGRICAYAGYTVAHRFTVAATKGANVPPGTAVRMATFGAAATSLRGGFSLDHRALRGAGASERQATVRVVNLAALEFATLAPAACLCAITLLGSRHVQEAVTLPWVICVPVGFAIGMWAPSPRRIRWLANRGRFAKGLARVFEAVKLLREQLVHPLENFAVWSGMLFYWVGEIVSLWAALRACGIEASIPVAILAYATGHALTPRTLPLAGAGLIEVLLPLALVWTGVSLAGAVASVFIYRLAFLSLSIPLAAFGRRRVHQLVARAG